MTENTGLDLDAIEARRDAIMAFRGSTPKLAGLIAESAADVPGLLAEVRRLQAQVADAWDEGLEAGCDRWMDAREFGDRPVNPYRVGVSRG